MGFISMRSGADYIFSIFQNHNCPPGTLFFFFLFFFWLCLLQKTASSAIFRLQSAPLTPNKMQIDEESAGFRKPPSFNSKLLTPWAEPRAPACFLGLRHPCRRLSGDDSERIDGCRRVVLLRKAIEAYSRSSQESLKLADRPSDHDPHRGL